jgi:hypothetical protein
MNRLLVVVGVLLLSVTASAEPPKDTVTIPLDQVWAYDMPMTRDIRELEPNFSGKRIATLSAEERDHRFSQSLVNQVTGVLDYLSPRKNKLAGPAFAVTGTGLSALRQAHAVLVDNTTSQHLFGSADDISIVFFSHSFGSYVRFEQIQQHGNTFDIQYRFESHLTRDMSRHFALIPIGKLPIGTYRVKLVQLPIVGEGVAGEDTLVSADKVRHIICQSFYFSVVDERDNSR